MAVSGAVEGPRGIGQGAVIPVLGTAHRHIAADLVEDLLQRLLVDVVGGQREAHRRHAAADVHPHRRRDDGLVGGDTEPMVAPMPHGRPAWRRRGGG
jgi:hypothetical protein